MVLCFLATDPPTARAETTIYSNSMEPVDWGDFFLHYESDSGQTITQTDQVAHTGSYSALFAYSQPGVAVDEYLVTPALDLSSYASVTLKYWEYQEWWTGFGFEHQICVSTTVNDDSAAFTPLLSMTPSDHPIADNTWQEVVVDLSAYAGQPTVYIAFRYQGDDADNWYVDDLSIVAPFQNNVGIAYYASPPLAGRLGQPWSHLVNVGNTGSQPLVSASLTWELNGPDGSLVAQETRDISGLGPGQNQAFEFATTPTLAGFYASQAWVEAEGDEDPGDNSRSGGAAAYSLVRTSVGMLGFNPDHAPSQEAEFPFDVFPEVADNTLGLIRLPSPLPNGDLFQLYYHAAQDIDFLRGMSGRTDLPAPPEFDVDNDWDDIEIGNHLNFDWGEPRIDDWSLVPPLWLELAQRSGAPLGLSTEIVWELEPYYGFLDVTVEIVDDLKPGVEYVLYSAQVEDDASGSGHDQVLRDLFPGQAGLVIDPTPGVAQYPVYIIRPEEFAPEKLRQVTFVVERNADGSFGPIVNADVRWWVETTTPAEDMPEAVLSNRLVGNAPNPFNPSTIITYELVHESAVRLEIFDLAGRLVRRLEDGLVRPAGRNQVRWDGANDAGQRVASGTYFYRLDAGDFSQTRRMQLVK